ncbi:Cyclic nucleotide-binding protein [Pseudocohnilembus persalinus]|uniref:Cyclic nucleotide-binding protein n=1 Tax=Pseudocohnilembus persalinus TaxID=266149 RepID=A0A0V0QEV6_PSEPJ|nr:Cyclic nucleotide-binding protein [Pseudocohnilembus persalinus]|eukprot:KRX00746.1 Cyclic nucleotide-binding protein [Pseudocohnilembus persalinus]
MDSSQNMKFRQQPQQMEHIKRRQSIDQINYNLNKRRTSQQGSQNNFNELKQKNYGIISNKIAQRRVSDLLKLEQQVRSLRQVIKKKTYVNNKTILQIENESSSSDSDSSDSYSSESESNSSRSESNQSNEDSQNGVGKNKKNNRKSTKQFQKQKTMALLKKNQSPQNQNQNIKQRADQNFNTYINKNNKQNVHNIVAQEQSNHFLNGNQDNFQNNGSRHNNTIIQPSFSQEHNLIGHDSSLNYSCQSGSNKYESMQDKDNQHLNSGKIQKYVQIRRTILGGPQENNYYNYNFNEELDYNRHKKFGNQSFQSKQYNNMFSVTMNGNGSANRKKINQIKNLNSLPTFSQFSVKDVQQLRLFQDDEMWDINFFDRPKNYEFYMPYNNLNKLDCIQNNKKAIDFSTLEMDLESSRMIDKHIQLKQKGLFEEKHQQELLKTNKKPSEPDVVDELSLTFDKNTKQSQNQDSENNYSEESQKQKQKQTQNSQNFRLKNYSLGNQNAGEEEIEELNKIITQNQQINQQLQNQSPYSLNLPPIKQSTLKNYNKYQSSSKHQKTDKLESYESNNLTFNSSFLAPQLSQNDHRLNAKKQESSENVNLQNQDKLSIFDVNQPSPTQKTHKTYKTSRTTKLGLSKHLKSHRSKSRILNESAQSFKKKVWTFTGFIMLLVLVQRFVTKISSRIKGIKEVLALNEQVLKVVNDVTYNRDYFIDIAKKQFQNQLQQKKNSLNQSKLGNSMLKDSKNQKKTNKKLESEKKKQLEIDLILDRHQKKIQDSNQNINSDFKLNQFLDSQRSQSGLQQKSNSSINLQTDFSNIANKFKHKISKKWLNFPTILPNYKMKIILDCWQSFWVIYRMFYTTIKISFFIDDIRSSVGLMSVSILVIINISFLFDIFLQFHTGYYDRGIIVTDKRKIAKNYIKNGLLSDILAQIPLFVAAFLTKNVPNYLLVVGFILEFLIFLKLVYLSTTFKRLERVLSESDRGAQFFPLIQMIVGILVIAHFNALLYHGLALIEVKLFDEPNSWLQTQDKINKPWGEIYIHALYWSISTMVTILLYLPETNAETIFAIVSILIMCCCFGYILNTIGVIVNEQIPTNLRERITLYLEFRHRNQSDKNQEEEENILQSLSKQLKEEVKKVIHQNNIKKFEMFLNPFSKQIREKIFQIIIEEQYSSGEVINSQLQQYIYAIAYGSAEVIVQKDVEHKKFAIKTYQAGDVFGIKSFFLESQNKDQQIISRENTVILKIELNQFKQLIMQNQSDYETFCKIQHEMRFNVTSEAIPQKCIICDNEGHVFRNCKFCNYVVDIKQLIYDYNNLDTQIRSQFLRIIDKTPNAKLEQAFAIDAIDKIFCNEKDDDELYDQAIFLSNLYEEIIPEKELDTSTQVREYYKDYTNGEKMNSKHFSGKKSSGKTSDPYINLKINTLHNEKQYTDSSQEELSQLSILEHQSKKSSVKYNQASQKQLQKDEQQTQPHKGVLKNINQQHYPNFAPKGQDGDNSIVEEESISRLNSSLNVSNMKLTRAQLRENNSLLKENLNLRNFESNIRSRGKSNISFMSSYVPSTNNFQSEVPFMQEENKTTKKQKTNNFGATNLTYQTLNTANTHMLDHSTSSTLGLCLV